VAEVARRLRMSRKAVLGREKGVRLKRMSSFRYLRRDEVEELNRLIDSP
jgi:hypothetical protein